MADDVERLARPYTAEEMRAIMFARMAATMQHWLTTHLDCKPAEQSEMAYRMEGFLFSILVMFDGGSVSIPALDIVPSPHETDEAYHRAEGTNWWTPIVINETQMHEVFPWRK